MEEQIRTLKNEIYDEISLFNQWSQALSNLLPVDYRSKVQWFGGIPGAIIEAREQKRMEKLINTPIVGEHSFWQLTFMIPEKIKAIGEKIRELQGILPDTDPERIKVGDDFINATFSLIQNWKTYSPAMATTMFSFGKGRKNNKSLIQYLLEESTPGFGSVYASPASINKVQTQLPLMLF